jgi:hypothetical protein
MALKCKRSTRSGHKIEIYSSDLKHCVKGRVFFFFGGRKLVGEGGGVQ